MTATLVMLCTLFAVMLAGGQLLFKLGANSIASRTSESLLQAIASPYLICAVVLYGVTTILWIYILTKMPLSSAYPFSLLGSMLVPLLAFLFLKEAVDARFIVGFAVMVAGLAIANFR